MPDFLHTNVILSVLAHVCSIKLFTVHIFAGVSLNGSKSLLKLKCGNVRVYSTDFFDYNFFFKSKQIHRA